MLNGRWAMQAATGHVWHLYYAYLPWAFLFFDRALGHGPLSSEARESPGATESGGFWAAQTLRSLRFGPLLAAAIVIALMVYQGAIYPLPHTLLLLAVYGVARALIQKSVRPLAAGMLVALLAVGLAAPKLLPSIDVMLRFPRLTDSTEYVELNTLVQALTAKGQTPGSRPARIPQWGWHEYGMYVGWLPFLFLFLAAYARSPNARALRYAGVISFVLGLGAFHDYAPWTLLHKLPMFASQHVPSRWLYPALLLIALCSAGAIEGWLERARRSRPVLESVLLALAAYVAFDVSYESNRPMQSAFWRRMPELSAPGEYYQIKRVPRELRYHRRDYAPEVVPAMMVNRGVIDCTLMAALNIWAPKDEHGRIPGIGAVGRDQRGYRGETYFESGNGVARITRWSPNRVSVAFHDAEPGDLLVLNQNYDPGWRGTGEPVRNHQDRVATTVRAASGELEFRFIPWGFYPGIIVFLVAVGGSLALRWAISGRPLTTSSSPAATQGVCSPRSG
jgi:hypothetical protein